MKIYRIHGDNIVECERIAGLIINTLNPNFISHFLLSPSTVAIDIKSTFMDNLIEWRLILMPGFNKNTKKRWSENIFDALKEAGSFFDETPDAIISLVENNDEKILLGIEFCSALQAGNQAWQRSARAFSTGRTGCPYLYIVDFVKYELDNETRARKNLRFPNAAVPYSYVNYSKTTGNFVAQLYTKSEEFDKSRDTSIDNFDETDFGGYELGIYTIKTMLGMDTKNEEEKILEKNMNVVQFLAEHSDENLNFTDDEWKEVYNLSKEDIVDYSVRKNRFCFHKTIAAKSQHGKTSKVIKVVDNLSVGLASRDLPFGIIPANKRSIFSEQLARIYPHADKQIIESIGVSNKHLLIAIFKGFKPRGDDNRPDRGLLPLAAMLSASDVDVMTYLYGPIIEASLTLLDNDLMALAERNGLWRSILALSNYVVLDSPVLGAKKYDVERVLDTSAIKRHFISVGQNSGIRTKRAFSCVPVAFGEDDVDTSIHYLFSHLLKECCFEGMCNPPGGDWSGFSVIHNNFENRWLSLPRVSDIVSGKRPDHILELFGAFEKPILLSIESKEKSSDLEEDVGTKLVTYIKRLMDYIPSAKRRISSENNDWQWGDTRVNCDDFEVISAAAYLKEYAEPSETVFKKNCEILFVMEPVMAENKIGWNIEIITSTNNGEKLKNFIIERHKSCCDTQFTIK